MAHMTGRTNEHGKRTLGWFGLGLFWCWSWIELRRPHVIQLDYVPWDSAITAWVGVLASGIVVFVIFMLAGLRLRTSALHSFWTVVSATILVAFCFFSLLPLFTSIESAVVEVGRLMVTGIMAAFLFARWGAAIGSGGTRATLWSCIAALGITFVLSLAIFETSSPIRNVLIVCLPVVSMILLVAYERANVQPSQKQEVEYTARPPKTFVTLVLVQGVALGLLHSIFNGIVLDGCNDPLCILRILNSFLPNIPRLEFYGVISGIGTLLAAIVLTVSILVLKMNFRRLVFQIGLPLMALGFLVIAASDAGSGMIDANFAAVATVPHAIGKIFALGESLYVAGCYYAEAIIWMLCSYFISTTRIDRSLAFSLAGCILFAGQLVGFLLGVGFGYMLVGRRALCVFATFVLLLCGLFITTSSNFWQEWGDALPTDRNHGKGSFKTACTIVAQAHGLTARETDIFLLLARGRNIDFAANNLFISKDTVKTHVKGLYRKLDVHSQQELIDRVEDEIKILKGKI